MTVERDVERARKLRLDQDRVESARKRARVALEVARYHQREANAARARAEILARTWGFDLDEI